MPYEPEFHRQGAVLLTRTGDASVWQFRNETGEGTMTTYELFPRRGAELQRFPHGVL